MGGPAHPSDNGCCPHYHLAVELIGRRWTGAIIAVLLADGPHRFSELRDGVPGVSDRVLSQRTRELESAGIVTRTVDPGPPVSVRYALTEKGEELRDVVRALECWGRRWAEPAVPAPSPESAAAIIEQPPAGGKGIALG